MTNKIRRIGSWLQKAPGLFTAVLALLVIQTKASVAPPATELYINEILFNDPNGLDAPNEYVELRGTPGGEIPTGTYLVGIEGDEPQGTGAGNCQTIFDLSGIVLGSDGFLTILMDGTPYTADAGSSTVTGNAGGFNGAAGFTTAGLNHVEEPSASFFLIQTGTPPTTAGDIDTDDDGTPNGAVFDSWTVLDSIGIADDEDDGADTESISYGAIIFIQDATPENKTLTTQPGATLVETGDMEVHYVARIGNSTGSGANDWVAGTISGTAPNFTLAAGGTFPDSLEGYALDHIGAPNFLVRPDAQIGTKKTPLIGDNIYNTGGGQKVTQTTKKRKTLRYPFKFEGDGDVDDEIAIRGTRGNGLFKATYLADGAGNVTAQVTAGTAMADLNPGEMLTGQVKVKPTKKTEKTGRRDLKRKKRTFNLDIRSTIDQSEMDRNCFTAKTK